MKKNSIGLTTKIFIGMAAGIVIGLLLYGNSPDSFIGKYIVGGLFNITGEIFKNCISLLVIPLVFVSLVNGSAKMGDIARLGRIGIKTLGFYLITTAIAISLALILAIAISPGKGLNKEHLKKSKHIVKKKIPLSQVVINMIPKNPIAAMADGNMLQIIIFAILTGISLASLGSSVKLVLEFFAQLDLVTMKLVELIMLCAPYGVFALIAKNFATTGFNAMMPLIKYVITVIIALIIHGIFTYGGLLKFVGKLSPIRFIKKFAPAMTVAFSTSSSNATIPATMEMVEDRLGVKEKIASFTIPLGATINMDGTAIMQGVAVVFISQIYGIPLTLGAYLTVIMTATLASIGTAGVPGVGLITLSMVLSSVGLPVEGVALIMGIDRILDMCRTAINICGDAVCTLIVAKSENEFDREIFDA